MSHANDLSGTSGTTPSDAIEAVKGKLSNAADSAREGLHSAERCASDVTDKAAHTIREAARHMRDLGKGDIADTLRDSARQVQSRASSLADDMRDTVVDHPLKTVAIAAGVGALVALLMTSRRA